MAYSKVEQAYLDGVVDYQFPDPVEPVMLADSGQVKSDAQGGFGTIGPIPRNKGQEALGYVGELLTKAGVQLDKVGLDIPLLGRITLKDLTVGDSGKVLEDMSYGFMPVEGGGNFISGTKRIKPDAALELLNLAPVVGAAGKVAGKAVGKAVKMTEGLPVGLSIKEAGKGVDDLGFYSAASKAVDGIQQPKGTGAQFLAQIEKTPGVKPEEIKWTGLDDFLNSKKTVTKQEVQDYLAANRVEVKEVTLAGDGSKSAVFSEYFPDTNKYHVFSNDLRLQGLFDTADEADAFVKQYNSSIPDGPTKFEKWTLPGGENYREILLTMPSADGKFVQPNHFKEPNILAHLRVNDRVDADGKKVLFVEEVQSDWHQAGRKKGYNTPEQRATDQKKLDALDAEREQLRTEQARLEGLAKPFTDQGKDAPADILDQWNMVSNRLNNLQREYAPIANQLATGTGVPDAPFKTNWHELALKRAIQMAAEGGYDRIAFTTGAQQASRYSLSKQVEKLTASHLGGERYRVEAVDKSGKPAIIKVVESENELDGLIGKEFARKIVDETKGKTGSKTYSGLELDVGGEGMKGFYDNIVPKFLDKYGKKWDAKTGMTEINVAGGKPTDYADFNEYVSAKGGKTVGVHYIDITPKMKESVLTQGQPLFAIGAGGAGAATQTEEPKAQPKQDKRIKYDANGRRMQ